MERKIGEIFEYNGEWYQCVESTHGIVGACEGCSFYTIERLCSQSANDSILGHCGYIHRTDNKNVIFKKLEKVGEPYMTGNKLIQRYKIYPTTCCINVYGWYYQNLDVKSWTIDIEIKQNKEDMEQEIEYFGDENNNAKHSNPESIGKNLKEFDLKAAKQGKPVCTRDGRKARIICFDLQSIENTPIVAAVQVTDKQEVIANYYEDGRQFVDGISELDLIMLPEKKEGWVNVYYDNDASSHRGCRYIYDTKERAVKEAGSAYITTVKINWEE